MPNFLHIGAGMLKL